MRAVVWIGVVAACGAATATSAPRLDLTADASLPPSAGLHVERNRFVDHGATVRLLGVNHSGTEYACVKGEGIFEGPHGDELSRAIVAWHANTVRIPLNEDCWLGHPELDARFSGATYRSAITRFVSELRAHGLYVVVDLHWTAPGTLIAQKQLPMADADHAIDFWRSVGSTFRSDAGVVLDLFNEPFLEAVACANNETSGASVDAWRCLRDGCVVSDESTGLTFRTAGTQAMLDAVRAAGARNVVLVPGLRYSSDLSRWIEHAPHDPLGQIAASVHLYNFSGCSDDDCFSQRYAAIAAAVPLVAGEIGEDDCGHAFVDDIMTWGDSHGVSYLGWVWNTWDCKRGPALIKSYDGTPTAYGEGLRRHLARR
jgi:endoglucanase